MKQITIILTNQECQDFLKPINGKGGGQDLVRELQGLIVNNQLKLDDTMCGKIARYTKEYKTGGFQNQLEIIKNKL